MLKIRDAQMQALEAGALEDFRAEVLDLLKNKFPAAFVQVPANYADRLLRLSLEVCLANGLDQQGSVIEFSEALLKNDLHPMSDARVEEKCRTLLLECRSRAVFMRRQALTASQRAPTDEDGEQGGAAAAPIEE